MLGKTLFVRATSQCRKAQLNMIVLPTAEVADFIRSGWLPKHEKAAAWAREVLLIHGLALTCASAGARAALAEARVTRLVRSLAYASWTRLPSPGDSLHHDQRPPLRLPKPDRHATLLPSRNGTHFATCRSRPHHFACSTYFASVCYENTS
jgi:hypothetical protein